MSLCTETFSVFLCNFDFQVLTPLSLCMCLKVYLLCVWVSKGRWEELVVLFCLADALRCKKHSKMTSDARDPPRGYLCWHIFFGVGETQTSIYKKTLCDVFNFAFLSLPLFAAVWEYLSYPPKWEWACAPPLSVGTWLSPICILNRIILIHNSGVWGNLSEFSFNRHRQAETEASTLTVFYTGVGWPEWGQHWSGGGDWGRPPPPASSGRGWGGRVGWGPGSCGGAGCWGEWGRGEGWWSGRRGTRPCWTSEQTAGWTPPAGPDQINNWYNFGMEACNFGIHPWFAIAKKYFLYMIHIIHMKRLETILLFWRYINKI